MQKDLAFNVTEAAIPHWLYNFQPHGIVVESGAVGLIIKMPLLFGSDVYIPLDGTLVAMVGLDADSKLLRPVGVGRIENKQVVSAKPLELDTLDYIGYAFVPDAASEVLQRYINNEINLQLLASELERIAPSFTNNEVQ